MRSSNPVFNGSEAFASGGRSSVGASTLDHMEHLENSYAMPAASAVRMGRMTLDDVVVRTGITLAVLLVGAVVGWMAPALSFPAAMIGLVFGLINSFKREPSPFLILTYAVFEGVFLGGISYFFGAAWSGIVQQAIIGTFAVFAATLFAFSSGKLRATPKFRRIVLISMLGYLIFGVVNFFLMIFGVTSGMFGLQSGALGLVISTFAIILAAASLVMDFDFVEQGIRNGLPERYAWTAAFGLTVTLVWLYTELLRLLAILRGDD